MKQENQDVNRRSFLTAMAAAGGVMALQSATSIQAAEKVKLQKPLALGFDNFSIRALKWKAPQLLEYAAKQKCDTVLFSDLGVYESLDEGYLKTIKAKGDELGIAIQAGTGSICPTSNSYNEEKNGPAEEHLAKAIRVAKALGSDAVRCYIGSHRDRQGEGGIYRHIEATAKVLKKCRSLALDAGLKIALENHAGDTQAWELAELFEDVRPDFVGATIDSGNATWTMEDPMVNLEILGPYTVSSGIRDSAVWQTEQGASVLWNNMGDGVVDWMKYFERYSELCPNAPVQLEILSGRWERPVPYFTEEHWELFPRARANEFAQFVQLAYEGEPYKEPEGRPLDDEAKQQLWDLEQSLAYCRKIGLGKQG